MNKTLFSIVEQNLRDYIEGAMEYAEENGGVLPADYDEEVAELCAEKDNLIRDTTLIIKENDTMAAAIRALEKDLATKRKNLEMQSDLLGESLVKMIGGKDKRKFPGADLTITESKYVDIDTEKFDSLSQEMLKTSAFVEHKVVETYVADKRLILAAGEFEDLPEWASVKTRLNVKVK